MRKILALLLVLLMGMALVVGCGGSEEPAAETDVEMEEALEENDEAALESDELEVDAEAEEEVEDAEAEEEAELEENDSEAEEAGEEE